MIRQHSVSPYDGTLMAEANGLIHDILADSYSLPDHVVSGLKQITGLLRSDHSHAHKPRISPLISLTEVTSPSDNEDSPYTGERVIPKRMRRSLPQSLIRRMSASTWTTTTSATGMPTMEAEPKRARTFRHSCDNTPSTSPVASRSSSPEGTTSTLNVPRSQRSFSISNTPKVNLSARRTSMPIDKGYHQIKEISDYSKRKSSIDIPDSSNLLSSTEDDQSMINDFDTIIDIHKSDKPTIKIKILKDKSKQATDTKSIPFRIDEINEYELLNNLGVWDYPIFSLANQIPHTILSMMCFKIFRNCGFFDTFKIPIPEFINYFHALEMGYIDLPYHNRIHASDVVQGVYYFTSQCIPDLEQINHLMDKPLSTIAISEESLESDDSCEECSRRNSIEDDRRGSSSNYGIMGANYPQLELMALYTAAAMHDYDHPGVTNAFLVATHDPLAILYNDRSVLESHHSASVWRLLLTNPHLNWLQYLEKAEFKRFRFLVVEAILATDLKQHFEMLAEFNAKITDDDAPGIDWTSENDRLIIANMVIKMADINGPCKRRPLHLQWTLRISEEFYSQGEREAKLGLPISPYMDKRNPQLAKLQESFINHLLVPLCNAIGGAGLVPGKWVDIEDDSDDETIAKKNTLLPRCNARRRRESKAQRVHCELLQNLQDNHKYWVEVIRRNECDSEVAKTVADSTKQVAEMLTIVEDE